MNLGSLLQDWGRKIPGHSWLSGSFLGDVVSGGAGRAIERNNWRLPFGHDTSSFDDLAGAGASRTHGGRNLARGVGAIFGGGGLYALLGGGGLAGGAEGVGGASEVGYGFPLAEEAGGAGAGGQLSGPAPSMGWQDYLRRYGRQGTNLLGNMMNQQGASSPTPTAMAPIPVRDPFADIDARAGEIPPGLIAMLLASRQGDTPDSGQSDAPYIRSGGLS